MGALRKVNTEPVDMAGNTWDLWHISDHELAEKLGLTDGTVVSVRPGPDGGYLISVIRAEGTQGGDKDHRGAARPERA
jgi:hypothetical protein